MSRSRAVRDSCDAHTQRRRFLDDKCGDVLFLKKRDLFELEAVTMLKARQDTTRNQTPWQYGNRV